MGGGSELGPHWRAVWGGSPRRPLAWAGYRCRTLSLLCLQRWRRRAPFPFPFLGVGGPGRNLGALKSQPPSTGCKLEYLCLMVLGLEANMDP